MLFLSVSLAKDVYLPGPCGAFFCLTKGLRELS